MAPTFTPNNVIFGLGGIVSPGTTTGGGVMSDPFAADAKVTASITNDSSSSFKVLESTSFELATVYVDSGDPSDLPGHPKRHKPVKTTELQQVAQSQGGATLEVLKGQQVSILVGFVSPAQSTDTMPRTATLEVQVDTSIVSIPLSALVAQVSLEIPSFSVTQNGTTSVSVTVTLIAGPATPVTLQLDSSSFTYGNVSAPPPSVQVSPGHPATFSLQVHANFGCPVGSYQVTLQWSAFNGPATSQPFSFNVIAPTLRPSPIDAKYASLNGTNGILGPSTGAEALCTDKSGQFHSYQHGVIYWSGVDGDGAFEVDGPIMTYIGADQDPANACSAYENRGYPTTDVTTTSLPSPVNGSMSRTHFQRGGVGIYSKPSVGTHVVESPILEAYIALNEANGVLGFPIGGSESPTYIFGDFENGGLLSSAGGPAEQIPALTPFVGGGCPPAGSIHATLPPSCIIEKVNQIIETTLAGYNKKAQSTGDHLVSLQGGARFADPSHPVTDYYTEAANIDTTVFNRKYAIEQDLFVDARPWPSDTTITITFELLLTLTGSNPGLQAIAMEVKNPAVSIDTHGNPKVSDSEVQTDHDKIMTLLAGPLPSLPIPLPGLVLSVKVLTTGDGVELTDTWTQLGPGTVTLLLGP